MFHTRNNTNSSCGGCLISSGKGGSCHALATVRMQPHSSLLVDMLKAKWVPLLPLHNAHYTCRACPKAWDFLTVFETQFIEILARLVGRKATLLPFGGTKQ